MFVVVADDFVAEVPFNDGELSVTVGDFDCATVVGGSSFSLSDDRTG